ncbi:unnamed protein product [Cuscuta epithymum]|uniref:GRF-type domain-containing protein n=1 Tax=Cuscuta epithymum TaxID=186058 RepID=A0AAV0F2Z2_9ASTE|nr:unnamed protein product [Cuscuta epithymum]
MSSSKSGSSNCTGQYEYGEWIPVKYCECGQRLKLLTTWKPENCGRRFWKCIGTQRFEGCGLMEWLDPPMCKRSQKIIPGLLKKVNVYEEKIHSLEMKAEALETKSFQAEKMQTKCSKCIKLVSFMCVVVVIISVYLKAK